MWGRLTTAVRERAEEGEGEDQEREDAICDIILQVGCCRDGAGDAIAA